MFLIAVTKGTDKCNERRAGLFGLQSEETQSTMAEKAQQWKHLETGHTASVIRTQRPISVLGFLFLLIHFGTPWNGATHI